VEVTGVGGYRGFRYDGKRLGQAAETRAVYAVESGYAGAVSAGIFREMQHHPDFVTFIELGALAAFSPDYGRKRITVNGGKAERREKFRGQCKGEYAGGTEPAGIFNEILYDKSAESSALKAGVYCDGTDLGEIFPQNVEPPAGNNVFFTIYHDGDDAIVLDILVKIERAACKHDAGRSKLVDQAGHTVHILYPRFTAAERGRQCGLADIRQGGLVAGGCLLGS